MKILVLNLPYRRQIVRKYACSYHANGFLYPPLELIRVCTIINEKAVKKHTIIFLDAIAEHLSYSSCRKTIHRLSPDVLITLFSVDFINEEYEFLISLKNDNPLKTVVIGYLPALYRDKYSEADAVLGNNFEAVIGKACASYECNSPSGLISGINRFKTENLPFDPDIIMKTDFSFYRENAYSELFAAGKTAFTYFSFGCPFKCTFCIKTYNFSQVYFRSTENILSELEFYWKAGIKNIRILDDNCTLNKELLLEILDFQKRKNIRFNYYGLTRIDLLDEERIELLKKLGFKNILIGIETINKETQNAYHKVLDIDPEKAMQKFRLLKNAKVEAGIFILFNPITETRNDIHKTLKFLKKLPVHFASISYITPYPGTEYFTGNSDRIEFSEPPEYFSRLKPHFNDHIRQNELLFMFSFYFLKPQNLIYLISRFIRFPRQSAIILFNSVKFLFMNDSGRHDYY